MNTPACTSRGLAALAALATLLLAPALAPALAQALAPALAQVLAPALAQVLAPALAPALGGELVAQPRVSEVHGAEIRVLQQSGGQLRGELLAVEGDRLWLLGADQQIQLRILPEIRRVEMDRHGFGSRRIITWTAVAGGVTGAAMFGACSSVNDAGDCGGFSLVWIAAWAGVGALSGLLAQPTRRVAPHALEELRPWARFPHGLPADFAPASGRPR